jgi:hypothetical protein
LENLNIENILENLLGHFKTTKNILKINIPLPIVQLEIPKEIQKIYRDYDLANKAANNK